MAKTAKKEYSVELPFDRHKDCQNLTELTIKHLPNDGSLGRKKHYGKDSYIWNADEVHDRIYFLEKGRVAISFIDSDGHEAILQNIKEGTAFGELCFCGRDEKDNSIARVVAPSETVAVTLADFVDYMQSNRDVLSALLGTYCMRLSNAQSRVEILTYRGAEERLGHLLLHLADSKNHNNSNNADKVSLTLSHNELAQMAAMSRPHVTITMNKFKQGGIVDYNRNRPLTVNIPALEKHLTGK